MHFIIPDYAFSEVMYYVLRAELGDRSDAPNIVLHITDGMSNRYWRTFFRSDRMKEMPYQVHCKHKIQSESGIH